MEISGLHSAPVVYFCWKQREPHGALLCFRKEWDHFCGPARIHKRNRAKAARQAAAVFSGLLGGVLPQGSCLLGAAEFSATKRR